MYRFKLLVLLVLFWLLSACATLSPDFEDPSVILTGFQVVPSNSAVPKFEIGLHIINPNRTELKLYGLSYSVELEGHRILTGVANDLPVIAAYGEGDILLQASPDLFNTISLFTDLMNQPRDIFNFDLEARLDVGKFLPKIQVNKSGTIALKGGNS